jgi:hypothetical protein
VLLPFSLGSGLLFLGLDVELFCLVFSGLLLRLAGRNRAGRGTVTPKALAE